MAKFHSYKEGSRANWGINLEDGQALTIEQVTTGAILRIADSLERMERPFLESQELIVFWKKIAKEREHSLDVAKRSRTAYKGRYTRLKKELEELKEEMYQMIQNQDIKTPTS